MSDTTWLVVGLGNIGEQYQKTRHNIGVLAAGHLAKDSNSDFSRHKKTDSYLAETKIFKNKILIAYLDCYMNESGGPVKALMQFYKIPISNLIILHDELDLEFTNLRLKFSGGDNGHNGLKSIRSHLASGDFYRVRLGIGRPKTQQDPASYVLEKFTKEEESQLPSFLEEACGAVKALIESGLEPAQNLFNKRAGSSE